VRRRPGGEDGEVLGDVLGRVGRVLDRRPERDGPGIRAETYVVCSRSPSLGGTPILLFVLVCESAYA